MSDSSIMSVRDMIDTCFGEPDVNIVNFKLMQTILYLLARQQRLLERQVAIEFGPVLVPRKSSLSITELKIKAIVPKKRQKQTTKVGPSGTTKSEAVPLISKAKSKVGKKLKSTDETTTSKSTSEPTTTDKTFSKSTADKTTTSKLRTEESTADKRILKSPRFPKDKTKENIYSDSTTNEKKSTEPSTSDKPTSKLTKDKTKISKASADDSTEYKIYSKSSRVKAYTKSTEDKTETIKSAADESTVETRYSKEKSLLSKEGSDQATKGRIKQRDYHHLLEFIEQQREQVLRIVNQRADSREVAEKSPTPMASLDSMEVQYEKLLVVERVPVEEAEKRIGHLQDRKSPKFNVVSQNKFDELAEVVKQLQLKLGLVDKADFAENMRLLQDLRRGSSLTDTMAAVDLSARLEVVEKSLNLMENMLTKLAVKKGVKVTKDEKVRTYAVQAAQISVEAPETKVLYDAPKGPSKSDEVFEEIPIMQLSETPPETEDPLVKLLKEKPKGNNIDFDELSDAMQELHDDIIKTVEMLTNKAVSKADEAIKTAHRLEAKLDTTTGVNTRMQELETLVSEYAGQINALDSNLTSQITNYQEQLTQMQHDLEGGLEAMTEALANPPAETPGVAELHANFGDLQVQFDITNMRQKDLQENQDALSLNIKALWKEIELLREVKSDRDEVAVTLRDKAGLGQLNGLVTQQQFDAVRGDIEQRIGASYDKFNNQEIVWQKIIDDLLRELNEKADWLQMETLRDDINNNFQNLQNKIHSMMEIIGEPHAVAISRRLFREAACLSCSTPAQMNLVEPTLPALPALTKSRPPTIGAEDTKRPKEDGDHGLCFPGQPIPHTIDSRAHVCRRYCGGSHTAVRGAINRAPAEMAVSTYEYQRGTLGVGSDGKVYMLDSDHEKEKKPCIPCNIPNTVTPPASVRQKESTFDFGFETSQLPIMTSAAGGSATAVSVTPPPPLDDYDY